MEPNQIKTGTRREIKSNESRKTETEKKYPAKDIIAKKGHIGDENKFIYTNKQENTNKNKNKKKNRRNKQKTST